MAAAVLRLRTPMHDHQTSYSFHCHNCGTVVDAMKSDFCRCISKKPSPVCGGCGVCWCSAPLAVRRSLWHEAPAAFRTRLDEERKRRETSRVNTIATVPTVLIVDDDEEIREIAAYAVEQLGYRAITVDGSATALDEVERHRPDVVITDALMPHLDGRDLCRLIKGAYTGTKVVIMTSLYTAPHYKYEAFSKFKADEYLPKPIDFALLRDVLARLAPVVAA